MNAGYKAVSPCTLAQDHASFAGTTCRRIASKLFADIFLRIWRITRNKLMHFLRVWRLLFAA